MQIKTILVHLTRRHGVEAMLAAANGLSRIDNAHLKGIAAFSATPPVPPLSIPYDATVIEEMVTQQRAHADELKGAFTQATADQPFVAEWVEVQRLAGDLVGAVLEHARAADLIVAGQRDPTWDLGPVLDFPEQLALESGRPVFLVPREGCPRLSFDTIAIAWSGGRECTRAVFDAMPFLVRAKAVHIFSVTEDGAPTHTGTPSSELAATLARHDIPTNVTDIAAGGASVSEALLSAAEKASADLLVLGAYGHSRLREFVFGGVTRDLLAKTKLPLLLSH